MAQGSMSATSLVGLSASLHEQFVEWRYARKPQEEKMRRMYDDMMRISRDSDTAGTGVSKAQTSRVFIGSTRSKIRSARAKIKDVMFGAGKMPFDTRPTNDDLQEFSDAMEEILTYQLTEGKFKQCLGMGTDAIATYGTGFIFGPFIKTKSKTSVEKTAQGMQESAMDYPSPYFEHGRTMDCYPDPEAENEIDGRGIYWASLKLSGFILELKNQKGYNNAAIDRAATETVSGYQSEGSDITEADRKNLYRYTKEGRVWFVRFFGKCKRSELKSWRQATGLTDITGTGDGGPTLSSDDPQDSSDVVECIVTMAGGQVIKAEENPYKDQRRPVYRCVYEDVEHEMWGVGVAENNDPNQRVTNAAFRLFLEGKAFALLKTFSVDRSQFQASEDFKVFPGKRWDMKPGLSPDERKTALIWHDTQDVTEGWEKVIALSEQFSDDDTGITKYTQGTDSQHLNDTATGISMIMNASALPLKEVISNIDERWIEPMIEALIEWDMEYLEPETVKACCGEKTAAMWAKIKAYGKTNFMEWFATGSETFMAKEVLMHKLQGFLQLVLGSEPAQAEVNLNELLQQTWDAGQIGKESPVMTTDQKQQQQDGAAQKQIQELKVEANKRIKMLEDANAKLQGALATAKVQAAAKTTELQLAKADQAHEHAMGAADLAEKDAKIDLLEAQTLKTVVEAGATASQQLIAEATTTQEEDGQTDGDTGAASGVDTGMGDAETGNTGAPPGIDGEVSEGTAPGVGTDEGANTGIAAPAGPAGPAPA